MQKDSEGNSLLQPAKPRKGPGAAPCAACQAKDISVCGALSPNELTVFSESMVTTTLAPGMPVVDEGEPERYVFSVNTGCLKCFKLLPDGRRQITGFLFPGDFLGLTRSETYPSSVEAVTGSTLCRMERSELRRMSETIPNLDRRLHELASEALAEVQGQIVLLGRKTAQERLATFLLTLSRRAGERGQSTNPVDVPMSRDDIGDFLGLTTETVSRTFSRLRKDGLIGMDKDKRIEIVDFEGLSDIAEGF